MPDRHLDPVQLTGFVHDSLLVVHDAHRLESLQLVANVFDERSNLVVNNLGVALVLYLAGGFFHLAIDVLANLF